MFFFFNDTATTEIYTLSLHDALPISVPFWLVGVMEGRKIYHQDTGEEVADLLGKSDLVALPNKSATSSPVSWWRSEEHTSELQSQSNLVCRLLLEKKNHPAQRSQFAH